MVGGKHRIEGCAKYSFLGIPIIVNGTLNKAVQKRNQQGKKAIAMLNGILRDRHISRENNKELCNSTIENIITYGTEDYK